MGRNRDDERPKQGCVGGCLKYAILLIVLPIALVIIVTAGRPRSRPVPAPMPLASPEPAAPVQQAGSATAGDEVILELPGGKGVFLATSDDSWNEVLDAENARSMELMGRLIEQGRAFRVLNGTRAVVVKGAVLSVFVRVTDGPMAGHDGWVQREFVHK